MLRTCVTPTSPMRLCTKMKYPCDTEPNNFVICRQIPRPPAAPNHSLVANCVLVHLCRSVPEFRLELLTVPVTPCMMCLAVPPCLGKGSWLPPCLGNVSPFGKEAHEGARKGRRGQLTGTSGWKTFVALRFETSYARILDARNRVTFAGLQLPDAASIKVVFSP